MKIDSKFLGEKYGLKIDALDAFLDKTARKEHLEWWIDREEELESWKKIIGQATSLKKNYIIFIVGSYGRGKTLSLLRIIDEAEKYKEILPIFLNFKGEEKSKPGIDFIFRIFKGIDFDKLSNKKSTKELIEAIDTIPKDFAETKTILKKIYFGKINTSSILFSDDLTIQTSQKRSEISKLALFFFRGEIKPSASQLKELGILRKIESVDVAKEYLAAILILIRKLGYNTLLLAIDEFEYLFGLVPKSQHSIYIGLLRGLYDFPMGVTEVGNLANLVFFISISESGWNSLKELENRERFIGGPTVPLLDRADATTILGVFDKSQTHDLIKMRLKYNRIKGKFEDEPLIPFTEDFVDFIYEKTEGEPRAIIVRCGHVLDAGRAERIPLLNKEFAQRLLEERGF